MGVPLLFYLLSFLGPFTLLVLAIGEVRGSDEIVSFLRLPTVPCRVAKALLLSRSYPMLMAIAIEFVPLRSIRIILFVFLVGVGVDAILPVFPDPWEVAPSVVVSL